MNKIDLLIKVTDTQLRVLGAIGKIGLKPEEFSSALEDVRKAFQELKDEIRKEE